MHVIGGFETQTTTASHSHQPVVQRARVRIGDPRAALNIALTHFRDRTPGTVLVGEEDALWNERISRIGRGESWATENAGAEDAATTQRRRRR